MLALLVLTARDVLRIKGRLDTGQHRLSSLDLDAASKPGGLSATAAQAAADLDSANDLARHSTWLGLLDHVPGVSGQIDGLREMTGATSELGHLASGAASKIETALDAASGNPAGRVALLDVALEQIDTIDSRVAQMHPAEHRVLIPPLSGARDKLRDKLAEARDKLAEAKESASALRRFLQGPTRVLVLAGNNAEMVAGSGMPNSGGVASVASGDISLGEFVQNDKTVLRGTYGVTVPPDLGALYDRMGLGYDFRGTTATPNFPVAASIIQRMSAIAPLFGPVDGVFVVDVFVIRDLLAVAGPVEIEGTTYTADNVMQAVLNDNYLRFGDIAADREDRAELQGAIARAAFDAIKTRHVELTALVKRLSDSAKGRHFMAWSADPALEKVFHDMHADGDVPADGLIVSPENFGGNKLDWYLTPKLRIHVTRSEGDSYLVEMTLTIANDRRSPTTQQVEGLQPERHFIWADVHAPVNAFDLRSLDVPWRATGSDPPMVAANFIDHIPVGTTKSWRMSFRLPADFGVLRILPSARVHPTQITIDSPGIGVPVHYTIDDSVERAIVLPLLAGPTVQPPLSRAVGTGFVVALIGFAFALSALVGRKGTPALALQLEPSADAAATGTSRARFDATAATWLLTAGAVIVLLQILWDSRP